MPGPFVIDASVFLNAFNPVEAGHEVSQEFLAKLQSQAVPIIVPTLLFPEASAAVNRGRGDAELAKQFSALKPCTHSIQSRRFNPSNKH